MSAAPDILLISIDSLRSDHLGCYGYEAPTSPFMDSLATAGVRFETAISTSSWTAPAHAALFTGLYDSAHGLIDDFLKLSPSSTTLAEILKDAGYATSGFFGGPYLAPLFGFGKGFDDYVNCMATLDVELDQSSDDFRAELKKVGRASRSDVTGPRTLEAVSAYLQEMAERPAFFFVHLWDVHFDYYAPREYVRIFAPSYEGEFDGASLLEDPRIHQDMSTRDFNYLIALYDGEIRFTDDIIRKLVSKIAERRGPENLLTIITSDHGDEFFDHDRKGHRHTLYDELIKVPLILHWPGHFPEKMVIPDQVRIVDVLPTLLSVVGIPLQHGIHGRDLSPLLRGDTLPEEPALSELLCSNRQLRTFRTRDKKLFQDFKTRSHYLCDLTRDEQEKSLKRLGKREGLRLKKLMNKTIVHALSLRKKEDFDQDQAIELDPETQSRLEGIGYLSDQSPDDK